MTRITQNLLSDRTLSYLQYNMGRVADLQTQLSTGRIINKPSDDPVRFPVSLSLRASILQGRNFQRNIDGARSNLELTESTMGSLTEVMQTIRTLAVQGGNSYDQDARNVLALEVSELYGQVFDLANANYNGQYIFSGSNTRETAFETKDGSVKYNGDDFIRNVAISRGIKIASNVTGNDAFIHTPNTITASLGVSDITKPLSEQLRELHPDFPNLPPLSEAAAGSSVDPSPNPANSPSDTTPNNYAYFTIYDTEIRVDLSVDSLEDVRDRINVAVDDVTAEIDNFNRLVITSKRSDALQLKDGPREIGFQGDPPYGANLLSALGMNRRVEGYRSLSLGYPATNPLTDGTTSPAPERATVRVEGQSFLFAAANSGPATQKAVPFGDNLALTDIDDQGNELFTTAGDPSFIEDLEAIRITIDDETIDLDLRGLTVGRDFDGVAGNEDDLPGSTLQDILDLITNHPQLKGRATAYINADKTGIGITATESTDVFKVENVRKLFGRDITRQVSIDSVTGDVSVTDLGPLTLETKLDDLAGALVDSTAATPGSLGIRNDLDSSELPDTETNRGLISITNDGKTRAVDLREAETVADVIRAINESGVGVEAKINDAGTGIDIVSILPGSGALSIVDMFDNTVARDLGFFSPPPASRIQSTGGLAESDIVGVNFPTVSDGAFQIQVRDGSGYPLDTYSIEVEAADTLGDIVKRIDEIDGVGGSGGGLISANLVGGVLNIVNNYDGHTITIDPASDTTGTDSASRFTQLLNIDQYTYVTEADALNQVPYSSSQQTASILGINGTGTVDEVEEKNIFQTIKSLEQALRDGDNDQISQALENIDFDLEKMLNVRASLGSRINRLDAAESRIQSGEEFMRQELSGVEDADLAATITDMTMAQNAFEAALAAAGQILQMSLLNYLS